VVHGRGCIQRIASGEPRVTSIDVAKRAGVSQSTVSLVLSGKSAGRISARTEAAVRAAADDLGYRTNVAARALRTGSARTIGLVVPDVTHPFFGRLLRGAQAAAWQQGYAVVLADAANDPEWELASLAALRALTVDGYLFFRVEPPPGPPLRAVTIEAAAPGMPGVRLDAAGGTRAALAHLRELGHRRIGHVASGVATETFRDRREAVEAVMEDPSLHVESAFSLDAATAAATELLSRPDRPTAVFADDDILAAGVYAAARSLGIAIPSELSVVGFDDLELARLLDPPLTTVAADAEALGAAAFDTLHELLDGGTPAPERIIPVQLVVRGSTAPPT
jgi:DNA-binding LacI/PurR family transcriptional regulator